MQKIINVLALASTAVSIAVVGTGAYVYVNKDAIIESVTEKALDSIGIGGIGGGGNGADPGETVTNGTANTGGGGGSAHGWCNPPYTNGNGGSGIVIIRYKYK